MTYICGMKRVLCLIFIIIYMCASCGATLHYNYKHGRLAKTAFWFNDANQCIKHGCKDCHTEYELVIVKTDSVQVDKDDSVPAAFSTPVIFDSEPALADLALPATNENLLLLPLRAGPHDSPHKSLFVRDCNFLL